MKKSEIRAALDALKEIKVHKFEDKELRNTLIENHFVLLDEGRKLDRIVEDKRKVFLEAYKDEEQAVQDLQNQLIVATNEEARAIDRDIRSHADYLAAVRQFNAEVGELSSEEIDGLKPFDRGKFMEEIEKQDFKLSWVEALYPMFK